MGYGRISEMPKGALPVFSCDTEEEAHKLLVRTCPKNYRNEFVAPELVRAQTLENLYAFGDRLQKAYEDMKMFGKQKPEPEGQTVRPAEVLKK